MRVDVPSNVVAETEKTPVSTSELVAHSRGERLLAGVGWLLLSGAMAAWAVVTYQRPLTSYEHRAIFVLPFLILLADLGARWSAYRALWRGNHGALSIQPPVNGRTLALPQVTLPLYLACAILLGTQTAVLAALLIEAILQVIALVQRIGGVESAIYRVAANGLVVLAGGGCYQALQGLIASEGRLAPLALQLTLAPVGALVMLALCPLVGFPFAAAGPGRFSPRSWLRYFKTSEARFQLLLLSIGPLLPLAAKLDDLEAEVAWALFLVPLFAIYYLALVSLRFQRQTEELRASLQALRQARRRQAELQDYAALVMRAQEDERRRLARELHDDTAQALIALSRGLEALADARSAGRDQADDVRWVEDLRELADRSLESVRRACRDLRPSILDDLGLAAALDWLAEGTTQRGLRCSLRVEGKAFPVPGEAELVFFRIAQEALANAWRHAHASRAEVLLVYEQERLRLRVQDDGRAFDLAEAEQRRVSGGLGLLGMRERAALVGAELVITTAPGQGTAVEVRLALPIEP